MVSDVGLIELQGLRVPEEFHKSSRRAQEGFYRVSAFTSRAERLNSTDFGMLSG